MSLRLPIGGGSARLNSTEIAGTARSFPAEYSAYPVQILEFLTASRIEYVSSVCFTSLAEFFQSVQLVCGRRELLARWRTRLVQHECRFMVRSFCL